MILVLSALRHRHSKRALERWFGERIRIIPLSAYERQPLNRDFLTSVALEIVQSTKKIAPSSRIYFLLTGNTWFNIVAFTAIRQRLRGRPFLVLVYNGQTYEPYSSEFMTLG